MTDDEWTALTMLCMEDVNDLSKTEEMVLKVFGAAGGLLVTLYGLASLLWFIVSRLPHLHSQRETMSKHLTTFFPKNRRKSATISFLMVILPTLTTPLFWGILRLRSIQKQLAEGSRGVYTDNQWTFGQVVSVMIFVPVLVEIGRTLAKQRRREREEARKRQFVKRRPNWVLERSGELPSTPSTQTGVLDGP